MHSPIGSGGLLAGVVLESMALLKPAPRTAIVLALLWCCALIGFAASDNYPVALALLFAAGFLELTFNAMAQTLVQLNAHEEIRGRTLGLFNMASLRLRAFSGVTVGLIGSLIGVHWSLALSALVLVAITCVLLWVGQGPAGSDGSCNQVGQSWRKRGGPPAEQLGCTSSRRGTWRSRNEKPLDAFDDRTQLITRNLDRFKEPGPSRGMGGY